jgi:L-seryl-tRNA(Ser) seleniumtransferase
MKSGQTNSFRSLPSVDALLRSAVGTKVSAAAGVERATSMARDVIDKIRREITNGSLDAAESMPDRAEQLLESEWLQAERRAQRRVINATGVVIHTNLGRAPLSRHAAEAIAEAAAGYCTTEYDLETGKRGRRGGYSEELLCQLTGAESALIVNNCAAAAFLTLTVLAAGGDVLVSRGELVEIGGDFRVPDVLEQSGARLCEVGTTNRTKLADYERSISDNTRLILRVHPSNYRVIGFTAAPSLQELSDLAHSRGLLLYEDAGSGALLGMERYGIRNEPVIAESLSAGTDIVTFSGDKLLGGPQCGLIVGRRELIEKLRKHPLYRALRVDKLIYAALQATLDSYFRNSIETEIPVHMMLSASPEQLNERADSFAKKVRQGLDKNVQISVIDAESAVGGGAAPDAHLKTWAVSIKDGEKSAETLAEELRKMKTPIVARVAQESLLIDLRTVFPEEEDILLNELRQVLA